MKKARWMIIGSVAVATALSAGAIALKRHRSWKDLKSSIASIPWDFEGQEKYR